ncbi:MAG: ISNCY family transposase, partial [Methanobacterium sp.]|nr:ISNCY family transposase [Methanobacterium sp.]
KYRLLNIFYNREAEIEILKDKAEEEEERVIKEKSGEECKEWLKKEMKAFKKFVHEKKRRNTDARDKT